MRHTEQEGAGGREEEVMLAVELATKAYRKSEMMRSGALIRSAESGLAPIRPIRLVGARPAEAFRADRPSAINVFI